MKQPNPEQERIQWAQRASQMIASIHDSNERSFARGVFEDGVEAAIDSHRLMGSYEIPEKFAYMSLCRMRGVRPADPR